MIGPEGASNGGVGERKFQGLIGMVLRDFGLPSAGRADGWAFIWLYLDRYQ